MGVLLLDVALAQDDSVTVHVLVDVHLEKLFELRHVRQVDLDGLLRQDIDCVFAHLGGAAADEDAALRFFLIDEHLDEHRLERILFVRIQGLRQVGHCQVKVVADQDILIVDIDVGACIDATVHDSLFERGIENVKTELVTDHVTFHAKNNKLGQIHGAILSTAKNMGSDYDGSSNCLRVLFTWWHLVLNILLKTASSVALKHRLWLAPA